MNIQVIPLEYKRDWRWVREHFPMRLVEDTCGVIAVDFDKGERLGAVVFDSFSNSACYVSLIIGNPLILRHNFFERAFKKAFEEFGLRFVYANIAENNLPSLKIAEKMGFKQKMTMPDGFSDGVDYIVFELERESSEFYKKMKGAAGGQQS